ncbi:MAG: transcriptional regulator [Hydrogenophaga sp.]|uniref:ChrR family anti-sigma-E factor n=1 Tax=Hydrogenophaga sp. TaxID=1904254 RepID=UPI0016BCFECB|nr:ChrR family anti-sigma-E factor [Hydrogenophaga sp.]NIM41456.1 transcriptional regulator [Hydrogenophaga sp.]NIN26772.1 transcriptional regulator [Hydrogenophaga sp.]NIN31471.1 transcriptional regulator [Hydrogenophaga sp.]NIN55702.1 transcriptional regulator [Hydrogenophaga sp.]NIO51865.1 transcriptional regulator [Hydrogenophaga sp.]
MDIQHHPDDGLLLSLATGQLAAGMRRVLHSHLELCPACRERAAALDALGGLLLDDAAPAELHEDALSRTLARIDAQAAAPARPIATSAPPPMPAGARWPRALAHCEATPWRWIGPGMRWSRVSLPEDPEANVFLLRIAAGKYLPRHTHKGTEFTQVLHGRFHDGRALFGPGDFDAADGEILHQPVVQDGSECICLASLDAPLRFEGAIARFFGSLVGM